MNKSTQAQAVAARTPNLMDYTPEQIELIKSTVAKGASTDELKLFLAIARRSGLDPFTKQIHFVKRPHYNGQTRQYDSVGTIQTGIDGYRAIAERSGTIAGIEDAVFEEKDDLPVKATVTVYRFLNGQRVPFTASARFSEYAQRKKDGGLAGMWQRMPYLMLAKCAEALALRKAFPNDLSGLYTMEEMAQADNEQAARTATAGTSSELEDLKAEITRTAKLLWPTIKAGFVLKERIEGATELSLTPTNYEAIVALLARKLEEQKETEERTGADLAAPIPEEADKGEDEDEEDIGFYGPRASKNH